MSTFCDTKQQQTSSKTEAIYQEHEIVQNSNTESESDETIRCIRNKHYSKTNSTLSTDGSMHKSNPNETYVYANIQSEFENDIEQENETLQNSDVESDSNENVFSRKARFCDQ